MKFMVGRQLAVVVACAAALAGCGNPAPSAPPPNAAANTAGAPLATAPSPQASAPLAIAPPTQAPPPGAGMAAAPAQGPSDGGMSMATQGPPASSEGASYCGFIRNTTANVQDAVAIAFDPGGGFSGRMLLGPSLSGGGRFSGTVADGVCSATTEGGVTFYGPCPANGQFNASYTIQGQEGVMRLTTAACPP